MDLLVSYLVEEGYADDYRSAEKILEYISDEFYEELVDKVLYEGNEASTTVSQLRRKAQEAMKNGNMTLYAELSKKMKEALTASKEENNNNKPDPRKTADPRTSWVSGNRQTPRSGPKASPDPREGKRNRDVEREVDRLIGSDVPKPAYLSPTTPAHLQRQQGGNQLWAADRRGERRGVTGQTRKQRRSSTTGRNENPNRFD